MQARATKLHCLRQTHGLIRCPELNQHPQPHFLHRLWLTESAILAKAVTNDDSVRFIIGASSGERLSISH